MKLLVAEDEAPQREALVRMLAELWPEARVVASCADGLEALEAYEALRPDVAFLDLRMPGIGGLELARRMADVRIVFVTAHEDAAVSAFEQGAVDYVLKPVNTERLRRTVGRLRERAEEARPTFEHVKPASPAPLRWVTASHGDTVRLYPIEDVLAFHAQDKYTRVLTRTDDAVIRRSLRELARSLDADVFWQVHRSVLVRGLAIDCIKRAGDGTYALRLKGRDETLPVSSAFHRTLKAM